MRRRCRMTNVEDQDDEINRGVARGRRNCTLWASRRVGGLAVADAFSASALRPRTSVTSTRPIGRPLRSTTGSSLNFRVAKQRDRVADARAAGDRRRAGDHHFGDRSVEGRFVAPLEEAGQVAVGEQSGEPAVGVGEHDRPGPPARASCRPRSPGGRSGRRGPCGTRRAAA